MFKVSKQKYLNKYIRSRLRPQTKYSKSNFQTQGETIDCYDYLKEPNPKNSQSKLARTSKAYRNLTHSKEISHNGESVGSILSPVRTGGAKYTKESSVEEHTTNLQNVGFVTSGLDFSCFSPEK